MNILTLLEGALENRGNAVLMIGRPEAAENAIIVYANTTFSMMMGQATGGLVGARLGVLEALAEDPAQWSDLMQALRRRTPHRGEMKLRIGTRTVWFGSGLTFRTDPHDGVCHGIMVGRDITEARQLATQESEMRHLLAAVFLRIAAPVTIVQANGAILMANPAFQRLLGYRADEILKLNVRELTADDFTEATKRARTKQLVDGCSYEMTIVTLSRKGERIWVKLTSVLLRDGDARLRVVTLLPLSDPSTSLPETEVASKPVPSVGEVQAVSLAAFKTAFGADWPQLAVRAMLKAEQILKRRLHSADVVSRSGDHDFVVWFESADQGHNAAVLAAAVREIRLAFLTEFGDEAAAHVSAVTRGEPFADDSKRRGDELLQELRGTTGGECRPVSGRDRECHAMVMVDFDAALRRRLVVLETMQPQQAARDAEIDLLRLDLALQEIGALRGAGKVLTTIAWTTLTRPDSRRSLDARLARLGLEPRRRLMLTVTGVPPFPTAKRWTETTEPLRRQLGDLGLMLKLADPATAPYEAIIASWPLTLIAIEAVDDDHLPPDVHFAVIAAARKRSIPVLVHAGSADRHDWRELGATLFA